LARDRERDRKFEFFLILTHILIVLSNEPDAKLPSDNVVIVETPPVCPLNVQTNDPVLGFHIITVESAEPDAKLPFDNVANVLT